jgi:hypothetical protein
MKTVAFIATSIVALAATAQEAAPKTAVTEASKKEASTPAEAVVKEDSPFKLDGGIEVRARYDWYDNLPNSGGAISHPYADYYRLRTRVWGRPIWATTDSISG